MFGPNLSRAINIVITVKHSPNNYLLDIRNIRKTDFQNTRYNEVLFVNAENENHLQRFENSVGYVIMLISYFQNYGSSNFLEIFNLISFPPALFKVSLQQKNEVTKTKFKGS